MKLDCQHAIVTGGSSGIGRAIALRLAARGARISIVARGRERLQRAQAEIERAGSGPDRQVLALAADVSDRQQAEGAIAEAIDRLGPPQLLVTCAGMAYPGHFQDLPISLFEQTMATNYFGTLYCIRAALPAMERQRGGHISLISSGAGLVGLYGYSAYGPSKFALRGLAETLRAELKPLGIKVSVVYPPDTDTPQLAAENETKPAATREMTEAAQQWSADGVARVVLAGIDKGQFEIAPGTELAVLTRLHSLIAPLLHRYFDRIVARHPRSCDDLPKPN